MLLMAHVSELLTALVRARAMPKSLGIFRVADLREEEEHLCDKDACAWRELPSAGLVETWDDVGAEDFGAFAKLTELGVTRLQVIARLHEIGKVCEPRPGALSDCSCLESMLQLEEAGWVWRALPAKTQDRQALAYEVGGDINFLFSGS